MKITVSTAPPDGPHEILDTIAAVGISTSSAFRGGPHLNEALDKCKEGLRRYAERLGADALVSCQFEAHFDNNVINLAGFGTAVRWT
ncbi:hypothetical protein [Pseudogemmobacter sp. W21_MBD1_M6]|uniref:hypothetical protein n=1 Tax=Pseudogemmobacter sp. W21_MBD1_M6 TaxID=3240271 RepID=UPI003F972349